MGIKYLPVFLIITCFTTKHPLQALMNDSAEEEPSYNDLPEEESQATLNKKLWDLVIGGNYQFNTIDNLLELGANPDAIINDTTQATVLEYAFIQRDFALLRIFFNPEYIHNLSPRRQGRTFLQRAIEDNDKEMINFLSAYQIRLKIDSKQPDDCCNLQQNETFFNRLRSFLKI